MNRSLHRWVLPVALGALVLSGCIKEVTDLRDDMAAQPSKFPNDTSTRVLNEMKRPVGSAVTVSAPADDRDARLAALEAELAAERAKVARLESQPPKVVEKTVEVEKIVEKRVEVPVPVPVEKLVEKTKIVKVPLIELRADALFDTAKAELRPNAVMALKNAADALKKFGGNIKTVSVDGHADSRRIHTREFPDNKALSEARAKAVSHFLIKHSGLPAEKFIATGYGDTKPIADNKTVEGQSQNRRVEVTVDQINQ